MSEHVFEARLKKVVKEQLWRYREQLEQPGGHPHLDQLIRHLTEGIEGRFAPLPEERALSVHFTMSRFGFMNDRTLKPYRWALGLNVSRMLGSVMLEPVALIKPGMRPLTGEQMRLRAADLKANLGQFNAEALLRVEERASKASIFPPSWRGFRYLCTGTTWTDRQGHLRIPYFGEDKNRANKWRLGFVRGDALRHSFGHRFRLVRIVYVG